jgi:hypothetical protein
MLGRDCSAVSDSQHLVWPWDFALGLNSHANYTANFLRSLVDRSSWYILMWVLPLGLARIRECPREWVASAGAASVCALALNAYHSTVGGGGGGIGHYVFDIAGPLLSLSAACLTGFCRLPSASVQVIE